MYNTGNGVGWRLNVGYPVREERLPVVGKMEVQLMRGADAKPEDDGYRDAILRSTR